MGFGKFLSPGLDVSIRSMTHEYAGNTDVAGKAKPEFLSEEMERLATR
jgi:hypothetical protein